MQLAQAVFGVCQKKMLFSSLCEWAAKFCLLNIFHAKNNYCQTTLNLKGHNKPPK